jgi:hypothetical protein
MYILKGAKSMKRLVLITALMMLGSIASTSARPAGVRANSNNNEKVNICHRTGSAVNPYVEIRVSINANLGGHGGHAEDFILEEGGSCPDMVATCVCSDGDGFSFPITNTDCQLAQDKCEVLCTLKGDRPGEFTFTCR